MSEGRRSQSAYVGLGSNLEDPVRQILVAIDELDAMPRTRVLAHSALYCSGPVGKLDQPDFINAVAKLQTGLSAVELMRALQAIETKHHRVRGEANAPRTLDLDLLLFGNDIIRESSLTVPHPRMHERAFVLMPLAEIGGGQTTIPGRGTVASLLAQIADQRIKKLDAEQETSLHRR
jgi:2-amino-4-hydroxy-6-hydroxymethyldihydropteridine diphosphokinase